MEKEIITEQRFTMLEVKLDKLTEKVQDIADDIKSHVQWEAEKYEKLDNKYSGKWVEKTLLVLIGIAATGIIGAIFKLIFK